MPHLGWERNRFPRGYTCFPMVSVDHQGPQMLICPSQWRRHIIRFDTKCCRRMQSSAHSTVGSSKPSHKVSRCCRPHQGAQLSRCVAMDSDFPADRQLRKSSVLRCPQQSRLPAPRTNHLPHAVLPRLIWYIMERAKGQTTRTRAAEAAAADFLCRMRWETCIAHAMTSGRVGRRESLPRS